MPPTLPVVRRPSLGALLAVVALGFLLGLAWLLVSHYQSSSSHVALADLRARAERVHNLDTLLLKVLDAESGVRGYLLTGSPVFVRPLQSGRAEIEQALMALRSDGAGDGFRTRLDEIEALINTRWAVLSEAVVQGHGQALSLEQADVARQLTEEIRAGLLSLRAETTQTINQTLEQSFERFAQSRQRNLALGLGVLVLLLVLVVMLHRQDRLRTQLGNILHSENERLQQQVAERTAELSALATYLTNTREAEQERLARELHDELGSLLTAAKLDASWIARKLPADAMAPLRGRFERLFDSLSQVIALKRKVVADLRPPLLSDLGLLEALRSMAQSADIGERGGSVQLDLPDSLPTLAPEVSLALYRIAQEALTNVRRYARASRVELAVQVSETALVLRVQDDGVGFDTAKRAANRHGLVGMAHRAQMMSGKLTVRSAPTQGTLVRVEVPRERWQ